MKENKRPIQTLMEEIERSPKTNRRASFDYLASCRQEKKKLGKPQINLHSTYRYIIKSLKNCKILN